MSNIVGVIYKATSPSGKVYIGKTTISLETRKSVHKSAAFSGTKTYFYNAIRKYKFENFKWEIIEEVTNIDDLNKKEINYIADYKSQDRNVGYNMTKGGDGVYSHEICGSKNPFYGKTHSEKTKLTLKRKNLGKILSVETKEKMSKSMLGNKNPMYGKKRSAEVTQKLIKENTKIYRVECPNGNILSFVGLLKMVKHFKTYSDKMNLKSSKRVGGRALAERKFSQSFRLLKNVIFVNGVWDVLHAGHIDFLSFCFNQKQEQKMELWVGIDSDNKSKKDKGDNRPFFDLADRTKLLNSLTQYKNNKRCKVIDKIIEFESNDQLEQIIKKLRPFMLIKDESWRENIVGEEFADKILLYKPKINISTSLIEERILKLKK